MHLIARSARAVVGTLVMSLGTGTALHLTAKEGSNAESRALCPPSNVVIQIQETDWDANGSADLETTTKSTYLRCNLLTKVVEWDYYVDGVRDQVDTTTNAYDHHGRPLTQVFANDWNGDGNADQSWTITDSYDDRGHVITHSVGYDWNNDGAPESLATTNNAYDSAGLLAAETITWTGDGGTRVVSKSTFTYDEKNRLLSRSFETHFGEYMGGDLVGTTRNSYDAHGNLLTESTDFDLGMDGTIDTSKRTQNTYDAQDRLLIRVMESGFDPYEPATDYNYLLETTTNAYDRHGNLVSATYEWEMGFPFDLAYRYIGILETTNTYDRTRNLLAATTAMDINRDGSLEDLQTITNSYDNRGGLLKQVTDETYYGSYRKQTTTNSYQKNGRLARSVLNIDWDGNGITDQRAITTFSYTR